MQGTVSSHAAAILAVLSVGLTLVFLSGRRLFTAMDPYENESIFGRLWRLVSGIASTSVAFLGGEIILAMANDPYFAAVCLANGLNPGMVALILLLLAMAAAVIDVYVSGRGCVIRSVGKSLDPQVQ